MSGRSLLLSSSASGSSSLAKQTDVPSQRTCVLLELLLHRRCVGDGADEFRHGDFLLRWCIQTEPGGGLVYLLKARLPRSMRHDVELASKWIVSWMRHDVEQACVFHPILAKHFCSLHLCQFEQALSRLAYSGLTFRIWTFLEPTKQQKNTRNRGAEAGTVFGTEKQGRVGVFVTRCDFDSYRKTGIKQDPPTFDRA